MIAKELLDPKSIVIVGASSDIYKPGGRVLMNIKKSPFKGQLYAVNPKEAEVQGVKCYAKVEDLPQVDCAILAIAAKYCPATVDTLALQKGTKGFIIFSAGFSELNEEGAAYEKHIVDTINSVGGTLIGPNCIGFTNQNYCAFFTKPTPPSDPHGIELISSSGSMIVLFLEHGMSAGLTFNSVWSVGNSNQTGIEDVLEHLDETFDPETSSRAILFYMEKIRNPQKLLKHARSLVNKGCKVAGLKSGGTAAGSRAVVAHTGSAPLPDDIVEDLFRKAGIVRCRDRKDLITVGGIFLQPEVKGKNVAIITTGGGPAVMLTDVLCSHGMDVPLIEGPKAQELLGKLFNGSSVANPIDFLATGSDEQLGYIIDAVENDFDNIDCMCVIYGSPGLFPIYDTYKVLDAKMKTCKKPIFPILGSSVNAKDEVEDFVFNKHHVNFPDECLFGEGLCLVYNTPKPQPEIDYKIVE